MPKAAPPQPLREVVAKPFLEVCLVGSTCWLADADRKAVRGIDVETGEEVAAFASSSLIVRAAAGLVAVVGRGAIEVRDVTGKELRRLTVANASSSLSLDGMDREGKVATGTDGERFVVWNPGTGAVLHVAELGHWATTSVAPDGSEIAIVRSKELLELVDVKTFTRRAIPGTAMGMTPKVVWSPDRAVVVLIGGRKGLVVDRKKRAVVKTLAVPHVWEGAFVAGRERMVTAGSTLLTVFDTQSWEIVGKVPVGAMRIAASEDGTRIVTADRDGPLRVWSTDALLGGEATTKPKTKAKAATKKPAKVRGVFFGVPKTVTRDALISAATNLHYILDRQPPEFAMELYAAGEERDRHWFRFLGSRGRNYELEPWIECLYADLEVPIDVVLHQETRAAARRFSPSGEDVELPPPDYLEAAAVAEPILVITAGRAHGVAVARARVKSLVNTVEMYYSPSFSGVKYVDVSRKR